MKAGDRFRFRWGTGQLVTDNGVPCDDPVVTLLGDPYVGPLHKGRKLRDQLVDVEAEAEHPVYGSQRLTVRTDQLFPLGDN
jgi:hypothetical protein